MLWTKTNVAIALNVKVSEIEHIWESSKLGVKLVEFKDWTLHPVTNKQVKQAFVDNRKRKAIELMVNQDGSKFYVKKYRVKLDLKGASCECQDYQNQTEAFNGQGCCKHIYAVLNHLGHSSLSDYVAKMPKIYTHMVNGCPDRHIPRSDDYSAIHAEANM